MAILTFSTTTVLAQNNITDDNINNNDNADVDINDNSNVDDNNTLDDNNTDNNNNGNNNGNEIEDVNDDDLYTNLTYGAGGLVIGGIIGYLVFKPKDTIEK